MGSFFLATISQFTIPVSDDEVIVFDTAPINPARNYNTATGEFTAPVNGYYQYVHAAHVVTINKRYL